MRRYCLTDCFKRKMSRGWDNLLQVLLVTLIFAGIIITSGLMFAGIGWLAVYFGYELTEEQTIMGSGAAITAITVLSGTLIYWLFILGKSIYKSSYTFIKGRYEGKPYKCSIFEECKDEPDE